MLNEEENVDGSPVKIRALPDVSKIMFSGIDPCALGSIVEVLVRRVLVTMAKVRVEKTTGRESTCYYVKGPGRKVE